MKELLIIILITSSLAIGIIWASIFFIGGAASDNHRIRVDSLTTQDTTAIMVLDTTRIAKNVKDTIQVNNGSQPITVIIEQPASKGMGWREMTTWCLGSMNTLILIFLGYRKIRSRKNENA